MCADGDDPVVVAHRAQRDALVQTRRDEFAAVAERAHLGPGHQTDEVGDPAEIHVARDDQAVVGLGEPVSLCPGRPQDAEQPGSSDDVLVVLVARCRGDDTPVDEVGGGVDDGAHQQRLPTGLGRVVDGEEEGAARHAFT